MSLENKIVELTKVIEKLISTLEGNVSVRGVAKKVEEFVASPPTNIKVEPIKPVKKTKVSPPPIVVEEPKVSPPPVTDTLVNTEKANEIVAKMKEIGTNLGDNTPIWDIIHSYGITAVSALPAKCANEMIAKLNAL